MEFNQIRPEVLGRQKNKTKEGQIYAFLPNFVVA